MGITPSSLEKLIVGYCPTEHILSQQYWKNNTKICLNSYIYTDINVYIYMCIYISHINICEKPSQTKITLMPRKVK